MTIRNTLRLSAAFSIFFSFLIIVLVVLVSVQINKAVDRGRSADAIVKRVYDLNFLTDEYLALPSQRILAQWNTTHESINQLLEQQTGQAGESHELLDSLRERNVTLDRVFESKTLSNNRSLPILNERQAAQLKINSQAMIVDATRLATLNFEKQESSRRNIVTLLIVLSLLFSIGIILTLLTLYRRVTEPLLTLRDGADRIADGDLAYRVSLESHDEFGQLAHSFNEMASRLQELYRNLDKKAWAAEEVVGAQKEFIAILSHELRNPLAVLLSTVEIMQYERKDDENISEQLNVIHRNIKTMRQLIDDLMEVSRIMREKITLKKETMDLRDLVKYVVSTAQDKTSKKHQHIKVSIEDHPLMVSIDSVRMTQILTNLIDNAKKFSPEKGIIEIEAYRQNSNTVVSVKDNGIGIRKEDINQIFEAFVQTKEGEKEGHGLGLGLKIVKMLLELHGGTISAHSKGPGHGSKFTIQIPTIE